jgi:hypothetical protein
MVVHRLRQLLNELAGVAERSQDPAVWELDRFEKLLFPAHRGRAFQAKV